MKSPFSTTPTLTVSIFRDGYAEDGTPIRVELPVTLRPWPLGYPEFIDRVFTPPVEYVNTEPKPDLKRMAEYRAQRWFVLLARALGDQLDSKPPADGASRAAWAKYADEIRDELAHANLVEGDVTMLITKAAEVNSGGGKLPKA